MTRRLPAIDLWLLGDTRERLRDLDAGSVHTCVTSPPYWGLRDYGVAGQLGLEATFPEYVANMIDVFREVRRVLREDGTLWLNVGDCYNGSGVAAGCNGTNRVDGGTRRLAEASNALRSKPVRVEGLKPKDMLGQPWALAFALRTDGWYLRSDIIWAKPNPLPERTLDRPTKAHEYMFLLSKSHSYYYDGEAVKELGVDRATRNRRSVWTIPTHPFPEAHFATMPPDLAKPCILAGAPVDGVVLDPFGGAGTTALVARRTGRRFVYIDLNPAYLEIARCRVDGEVWQAPLFGGAA